MINKRIVHALRVLRDKMDDIVDALEPGGSGDPYATLNAEQRLVLQEVTRLGFPIKSWYGWDWLNRSPRRTAAAQMESM